MPNPEPTVAETEQAIAELLRTKEIDVTGYNMAHGCHSRR